MNRVVRLRCEDVTPLQIWDLHVGGGQRLWQLIGAKRVEELKRHGADLISIAWEISIGIERACAALESQGIRFDTVYLAGGGASLPGLQDWLREPPIWIFGGRNYALEAKQALFGDDHISVVDVGQTSIKCFLPNGVGFEHARDTRKLPYGDGPEDKGDLAVEFVAEALRCVTVAAPTASILLSLPVPINDELVPGESSYGIEGRASFIPEVLSAARVSPETPVMVINDAELAAESARAQVYGRREVLVITMGLGPGGAHVVSDG